VQPENDHWIQQHRWAVGERIRAARRQRGLGQLEFSQQAGLDIKTISRAENGVYAISIDQLARIARVLNIPSAQLLPDDRPPGPDGG
jgi:transcriptional regulator with XRE-family HTH domain